MEEKRKYALYTIATENYVFLTKLMIYSFLYNNKWFDGDINIICYSGASNALVSREELKKLYGKINFIDVNLGDYVNIFKNAADNASTMVSYLKFEVFNGGDYDRRVYLDSDVIVNGDIKELFEGDLANMDYNLIACRDFHISEGSYLDNKSDVSYFNAGVLSVPKGMCDGSLYSKFMEFASDVKNREFHNRFSKHGQYVDQDVFNEFMTPDFFPNKVYNCSADFLERKDFDKVKIFHYYGRYKPYMLGEYRPAFDAFYKYFFFFTNRW